MNGEPITAVATPPGRGALAIVRVSGPGVAPLLSLLTGRHAFVPRHATRVSLALGDDFHDARWRRGIPRPHSYTGEDCFELSVHGSPVITATLLGLLSRHGVRTARPGEFTLRAYLHGKIDLIAAEAVDDVVRAVTPAQARSLPPTCAARSVTCCGRSPMTWWACSNVSKRPSTSPRRAIISSTPTVW